MARGQTRAMEEAFTWTARTATTWAKSLRSWPKRRFRVEGSSAGNSRLLDEYRAQRTKDMYGGEIVELIPSSGMRRCGYCRAKRHAPCQSSTGKFLTKPHAGREEIDNG